MSNAHRRLLKAYRFLELAQQTCHEDPSLFSDWLESAIEAARTVTWLLKKEFSHRDGFAQWYEGKTHSMDEDSLMTFFRDLRNVIVKEGPIPMKRAIHITASVTINIEAIASLTVRRIEPWYRRPGYILLDDCIFASKRRLLHLFRAAAQYLRKINKPPRRSFPQKSVNVEPPIYYFLHGDWQNKPAIELVKEYLERLKAVVSEAEERFESPRISQ